MSYLYIYLLILIIAGVILYSNLSFGAKSITKNQTENLFYSFPWKQVCFRTHRQFC